MGMWKILHRCRDRDNWESAAYVDGCPASTRQKSLLIAPMVWIVGGHYANVTDVGGMSEGNRNLGRDHPQVIKRKEKGKKEKRKKKNFFVEHMSDFMNLLGGVMSTSQQLLIQWAILPEVNVCSHTWQLLQQAQLLHSNHWQVNFSQIELWGQWGPMLETSNYSCKTINAVECKVQYIPMEWSGC